MRSPGSNRPALTLAGQVLLTILLTQTALLTEPALSQGPGQIPASAPVSALFERMEVNTVEVEVFVVDKKGRPVTDLTEADFVVREDGKRVELTHFGSRFGAAGTLEGQQGTPGDRPLAPARFLILVDNYAIDAQSRKLLLNQLRKFIQTGLEAGDLVAVASYEGHLELRQEFTADRDLVLAAIDGLEKLDAAGIARHEESEGQLTDLLRTLRSIDDRAQQEGGAEASQRRLNSANQEISTYSQWVRSQVKDTFQEFSHLVNSLAAVPGRKAVVYVSEGLPMRPGDELYFAIQDASQKMAPSLSDKSSPAARDADLSNRSGQLDSLELGAAGRSRRKNETLSIATGLNELVALANSSQVSFYSIKTLGGGAMTAEIEGNIGSLYTPQMINVRESNLNETLRVMGETTGGGAAIGGDVQAFLRDARDDFSSPYSLAYTPAHQGDGQYHEIEVKVRRRGTRIRHRTGYVDKSFGAQLADLTTAALLLDFEDNPLGVTVTTGEGDPGPEQGQWIVPIVVRVPLDNLALLPKDGGFAGDAQILVAVREPNGRSTPVQAMAIRIEISAARMEEAAGAVYPTELRLLMREGEQRLSIGFVDTGAGAVAFVSTDLTVGP